MISMEFNRLKYLSIEFNEFDFLIKADKQDLNF